jgi:hypothetical protein
MPERIAGRSVDQAGWQCGGEFLPERLYGQGDQREGELGDQGEQDFFHDVSPIESGRQGAWLEYRGASQVVSVQ